MKAQVLTAETGPAGLELTDVADPAPADGQVLVDIKSCGVCFPDLLMSQGKYQLRMPTPFTPGTEVAGVVREAPAGSSVKAGDKVLVASIVGGFAEQVAAAPEQLLPLPEGLTFDQGAAMGINYQTALFALKLRAQTAPGEIVGVLGAAGGVGTASIMVAKAMGAKVIAIVHRKGAEELLRSAGADEIVALEDGWGDKLREVAPEGVDVMIDPSGGEVFDEALRQVAPDGRYVVIGFAAGGIPTVKLNRVLFRNISVVGAAWGEYVRTHPGVPEMLHDELAEMIAAGLQPQVNVTYSLDELPKALTDLAEGRILGKAVVKIAD
ncbi:NADPH:quinone oxidoreductase family protein [Gordonia hankookensis]|uniref:NADPH:quinone oxidoreductase family protein n=1 Tax=Gordonia hankookensis TaxID=589403 RepID=A0ABR7W7Z8_9ACTN|nr:NADPH:quinone oxidoreductase family protein [Gordonia hankookensis]MBD1318903.1 NADPH:quinone oxidoreductase family protein [Gordonia hankookensis]NDZ94423.1 NADPH:quinone oxidoreductase family protein [Streptomyces sp. SID11726]NEB24927.1 NADPH:quinone oxidoreductase family protein [Streptomyces sp. SID6673]